MNITLADLRAANLARQEEWCPDQKPDLSFRGNELAGEIGETIEAAVQVLILSTLAGRASNLIKKLERERHGWIGSRVTTTDLAEELGDIVICCDLVAITAGISLQEAVVAKFNSTSEKNGLSSKLSPQPVAVKALEWSEHRAPNEEIRYDHCVAESIFGQISIEWKGWKDYPGYTAIIGDEAINGNSLEAAKAAVQAYYECRIRSALSSRSEGELEYICDACGGAPGYAPGKCTFAACLYHGEGK